MASARRFTLSTAIQIARRIDLSISTSLKQWRGIPQSILCNKNRDISTAVKQWRGIPQWSSHDFGEIGYPVDVADLLSTPERDFLVKNNGQKVPISSLKGKLVGLYFCENIPDPPHMQTIKKVYDEAKSRGYDFEIVQITLHYHRLNTRDFGTECYEDISWLAVPSMDPGCRKIQQLIFECIEDEGRYWDGDCLVLIHPRKAEAGDSSGVVFEFEGAKVLERWGIEGYPFTRPSLYKAEYEVQQREAILRSIFPPGECLLRRPLSSGDGFDHVDAFSQLSGKKVLVWFAPHRDSADNDYFLPMLKSKYRAQIEDNVAEENKFEVVYVSIDGRESSFDEFTKDMPWLVRPFSGTDWRLVYEVFKMRALKPAAVAFNELGELIAKENDLHGNKEGDRRRFPFIDQDLEKRIPGEVEGILGRSIDYKKNHDLSTAVKHWRGSDVFTAVKQCRLKGLPFSKKDCYDLRDIGYNVDFADLLFTPERDFLVKNNGQKIKIDDLKGKTIVLFIVPLDMYHQRVVNEVSYGVMCDTRPGEGDEVDMIDAYYELLRMESDVEFVFVPVQLYCDESVDKRQEDLFDHLFSIVPFPAIPFSDVQGLESPVVQTFSVDDLCFDYDYDYGYGDYDDGCNKISKLPYWVVIDPANTVVATRYFHPRLFKLFGGAELHPLSQQRISALEACYESESMTQRISKWDQLLASDTRDFLLSSNGDKVPISSLKGKLVGLYFCENIPQDEYIEHPPSMQAIKKVYEEAKSRGYDFEIVQITFHYHPFNAKRLDTDPTVQHCCEDVSWLTLPFKDPSCRKIQRIFQWVDEEDQQWLGDGLVLIHPRQAEAEDDHSSAVFFELAGAYILKRWGIEGYPFTRQSLYEAEYEVQKREVRLQLLFPPEECLRRSACDGFDLVEASQLSGKRVLVLFAPHHHVNDNKFVSMLKSEYKAQVEDNVREESKFEVVYVSTAAGHGTSFDEVTKDMPWLVRPFSWKALRCFTFVKVCKWNSSEPAAVAFNEQGELIAKEYQLSEKKEGDKLRFPFIDQDLEKRIRQEVEAVCG